MLTTTPFAEGDRYAGVRWQIADLMRRLHRHHGFAVESESLTSGEASAILAIDLAIKKRGSARPGWVAKIMHTTPSVLSQTLKTLEERKLIVRARSKEDSRAVAISLTEEGSRALEEIHQQEAERASKLFDYLGEKDIDELIRILTRIVEFQEGERGHADL